jgi:hypothetical protein
MTPRGTGSSILLETRFSDSLRKLGKKGKRWEKGGGRGEGERGRGGEGERSDGGRQK